MTLLAEKEMRAARAVAELEYCNPFLPERIEYEQMALGPDFVPGDSIWHSQADPASNAPNILALQRKVEQLVAEMHLCLQGSRRAPAAERELYFDLVTYALYYRYHDRFRVMIRRDSDAREDKPVRVGFYDEFCADLTRLLHVPGLETPQYDAPHLFACMCQVRRAFHYVFHFIVGSSMPTARLRAAVWQSVFTHDMRRYRRFLFRHMGDIAVLVTGPSGTGKELVARAVAFSRYIPFDPETKRFATIPENTFFPLNLSALSPTLIESELFGHRRGAFTGALSDHVGWLEACGPNGTVFLDEIGDVDTAIQVKLLRALESRQFQRLGETEARRFEGKLIAATNRDLAEAIRTRSFREDLYYRLCSDLIVTPSLQERIRDCPQELENLVLFLATRLLGAAEAGAVSAEVTAWIDGALGRDYDWPGNVRELEQCVRNILIRKEYRPSQACTHGPLEELAEAVCRAELSADEIVRRYCTIAYSKTRNFAATARQLELDTRTLKKKIDTNFLERLES